VVNGTPQPLYPLERPGTHCIGGWVGPRAGLDGCGKSRSHRDSNPGLKVRCKSNFAHFGNEYMVRLQGGCTDFPKDRIHLKVSGAIAVT